MLFIAESLQFFCYFLLTMAVHYVILFLLRPPQSLALFRSELLSEQLTRFLYATQKGRSFQVVFNFLVNLLTFVCKYAIIYAYNIRGQQDERIPHNSLKAAAKVFR